MQGRAKAIARSIGRSQSAVSKGLKRGRIEQQRGGSKISAYFADAAQLKADNRRKPSNKAKKPSGAS